ncbi:hypothetical protein [Sulfitobacter geojensis]|uniref:hypothetical protein n=1 Tax=Sulfitobacter geojensis TaxID=1342299 RepID=UPI0036D925B0
MWMKQKTTKEIALEEFAKKHKNKHLAAILEHPYNKNVAGLYRAKKLLPKGTIVWLLDPKVKVYVATLPNGKREVLTEKQYKAAAAKVDRALDNGLRDYERYLETMIYRHDIQLNAYEKFPIISFLTSSWYGKGKEPVTQRAASEAAVKNLKKVVSSRNYARFKDALFDANKAAMAYRKGIDEWIQQNSGSAANWESGCRLLRDGGFLAVGIIASVVVVPVTAGTAATLGYGALIGGTTSALQSSSNELGRSIAGEQVKFSTSLEKVAKDTIGGGIFGLAGAGIGKFVSGKLVNVVAKRFSNSTFLRNSIKRLVGSKWYSDQYSKLFTMELEAFLKASADDVASGVYGTTTKAVNKAFQDRVGQKVAQIYLANTISAISVDTLIKPVQVILTDKQGTDFIILFLKRNATNLTGSLSEDQLAKIIATDIEKDPIASAIVESTVREMKDVIGSESQKEIRKEIQAAAIELRNRNKMKK